MLRMNTFEYQKREFNLQEQSQYNDKLKISHNIKLY